MTLEQINERLGNIEETLERLVNEPQARPLVLDKAQRVPNPRRERLARAARERMSK